MTELKQATAATVPFEMVDTDGAAVTGLTPSVQIRKPGGAFAAATNAASEVGLGVYEIALTPTETNTPGPLIFSVSGTGAETARFQLEVVANKTDDVAAALAVVDGLVDTLVSRLTAARAGYLDKLNVSGTLAHSDAAATYRATGYAVPGDAMALTPGERSTLATTIEAALLNEGDGQQLIDAILQVINANLDLPALELTAIGQAVRSELATELARLDTTVSSRLSSAVYTAPDNAGIAAIETAVGALGASGDPWATLLPGVYAENTAGAAIERLLNTPAENPIAIIPTPPANPDLAVVYLDTEDIVGEAVTDAVIQIRLESTQPVTTAEGRLVSSQRAEMIHDPATPGRYTITLETGLSYRALCGELFGQSGKAFTLAADAETLNLAD